MPYSRLPAALAALMLLALLRVSPLASGDPKSGDDAKPAPPQAQPKARAPKSDEAKPPEPATAEYFEYRYSPELGSITISDCSVRGARPVKYLRSHAEELAQKGIFACTDEDKRHVYKRRQKVGERMVDSLVVIDPPTHEDEGGDSWTGRLVVRVDGKRKIDCTLGTTADGELWVNKVALYPEDGTLEIRALTGDGEELSVPEEYESLDSPTVITDETFYEDDPGSDAPGTVKT